MWQTIRRACKWTWRTTVEIAGNVGSFFFEQYCHATTAVMTWFGFTASMSKEKIPRSNSAPELRTRSVVSEGPARARSEPGLSSNPTAEDRARDFSHYLKLAVNKIAELERELAVFEQQKIQYLKQQQQRSLCQSGQRMLENVAAFLDVPLSNLERRSPTRNSEFIRKSRERIAMEEVQALQVKLVNAQTRLKGITAVPQTSPADLERMRTAQWWQEEIEKFLKTFDPFVQLSISMSKLVDDIAHHQQNMQLIQEFDVTATSSYATPAEYEALTSKYMRSVSLDSPRVGAPPLRTPENIAMVQCC